jgi:hypothetical protein
LASLAADELYDGPFCVLSIVDNRTFKRLFYQVLDHDPAQVDIIAFFQAFRAQLDGRSLSVHATPCPTRRVRVTTDGSTLYPGATLAPRAGRVRVAAVFGEIPHQICQFHARSVADLSKAVLHAVASVRKGLATRQPKLKRGRPTKQDRPLVRQRQRLQAQIADLFTHRYLFARSERHLTPCERETLQRITRGLPHLRALRAIMDDAKRIGSSTGAVARPRP